MQKAEALQLLGGSVKAAAEAVGISTAAVSQWPDTLPPTIRDRVQAALYRRSQQQPEPAPAEARQGG